MWCLKGLLFVAIASSFSLAWATDVPPGDITGIWTAGGSPYIVQGHLTVPSLQQLTIEPGVEVRFNGPYVLKVIGTLMAKGTAVGSIYRKRATSVGRL